MDEETIEKRIREIYPDAAIEASGADCSFEVYVVSEAFDGMNTLKRQQSILGLFKDELATGKLHALGIKAKTPDELSVTPNNLVQITL